MKQGALLNERYQLLDRLGSGGMADVFRARDLMLDRYVAIKILRKDYTANPGFQERFRQEARAAANLSHPNIVTVHDFGLDEGQIYHRDGIHPRQGSEDPSAETGPLSR